MNFDDVNAVIYFESNITIPQGKNENKIRIFGMYIHTPSSRIGTYTKIEQEQLNEKPDIKTRINKKKI